MDAWIIGADDNFGCDPKEGAIKQIHELAEKHGYAVLVWSVADVLRVKPELTVEQARQVLRDTEHCHNAARGVTWETLKIHAVGNSICN
jgi:hypothetical protein